MNAPQLSIKTSNDIVAYIGSGLNRRERESLARMVGSGSLRTHKAAGERLWRLGLAVGPRIPWYIHEMLISPTFLGRLVYRWLKAQGIYDLRP